MTRQLILLLVFLTTSACSTGQNSINPNTFASQSAMTKIRAETLDWSEPPENKRPERIEFFHLAPKSISTVPRWEEEHFGHEMPDSTWRPADQNLAPLRWDAINLDSQGNASPGEDRYTVFHANGCCGACQAVAMLGAVLTQHRIDGRSPVPSTDAVPHRAAIAPLDDELALRVIFGLSRHVYMTGGRDVPNVSPALALGGAPRRSDLAQILGTHDPWLPAQLCQSIAGKNLPVFRARVREHDVRFMTVALRQGPVIISGAFNRLKRGTDDIYRCPADASKLSRHHFMLVVGYEYHDSNGDGVDDEVVWLVRDDWNRRRGEHQTWDDQFPNDEWGRIVPKGCLLDHGRAHSIIPGTVLEGSFDDPVVPGTEGEIVSICESDPDGDGIPIMQDL